MIRIHPGMDQAYLEYLDTQLKKEDLQRAKQTAEPIAKCHKLQVQPSPAWREIDMGEWECGTISLLHKEAPEMVAQLFNDPSSFKYPGGESFAVFISRVQTALDQLLTTHGNGEVALVTHGGVCRAIIGNALGMPSKYWLRLAQAYGCLNVFGRSAILNYKPVAGQCGNVLQ